MYPFRFKTGPTQSPERAGGLDTIPAQRFAAWRLADLTVRLTRTVPRSDQSRDAPGSPCALFYQKASCEFIELIRLLNRFERFCLCEKMF